MNFPFDEYTFSGDIGRINPLSSEPLIEEVVCPQMRFNKKQVARPTMTLKQCLLRIKENNPCTKNCKEAKKLRKRHAL
jgi:hypothetical protein